MGFKITDFTSFRQQPIDCSWTHVDSTFYFPWLEISKIFLFLVTHFNCLLEKQIFTFLDEFSAFIFGSMKIYKEQHRHLFIPFPIFFLFVFQRFFTWIVIKHMWYRWTWQKVLFHLEILLFIFSFTLLSCFVVSVCWEY